MKDILFLLLALLLLGVLIFVPLYFTKKYDNKKKFVKEKGFYYNKVVLLNNKYEFNITRKKYRIDHRASSKRGLDNLDLSDIVMFYLNENIDDFRDNFISIGDNLDKYKAYEKDFDSITRIKYKYKEKDIIGKEFKSVEKFSKFEKNMTNSIKYKNKESLTVMVYATYISPKGRNSYYKNAQFDYNDVLDIYQRLKAYEEFKSTTRYQRSIMTDSLRYDILRRDNFRCQICGTTAKEGAKLHVDHIIPISKGGKTTPDNLQTLCERCNMGKSNKM